MKTPSRPRLGISDAHRIPCHRLLSAPKCLQVTTYIPDRLKTVTVSVTFAKLILLSLEIPRCNCTQRVFHRKCYNSGESIRLRITKCKCAILFEIITFLIRKPLNHVTVIAENSWECLRGIISCNCRLQEKQGNCNCNAK